jgi:predicted phosphodiesterase
MIGILSDIHGNHIALEAVLSQLASKSVENIVILGDVAAGTAPHQVLARVRSLGCPVVMGNTDAWLLDPQPFPNPNERQKIVMDTFLWAADQLDDEEKDFIRSFQPVVETSLHPNINLLAYHGSPRSYDDVILPTTPDDDLRAFFEGVEAVVMAGGHTHAQMLRKLDNHLIINPGSVGLVAVTDPQTGLPLYQPYAEYAVIDAHSAGITINFHRIEYDVEELFYVARSLGKPHLDWWINHWQTSPPSG